MSYKKIRKLRGISQKQLGTLIGSQSMVSRIENNQTEPNDHTLFLLCRALNISFDEYFNSVFGQRESYLEKLESVLLTSYIENDRQQLNNLTEFYFQRFSDDPNDLAIFHQLMMVKATLFHFDFKLASFDEQNKLIEYFFGVQEWQYYDLSLLEWTINMLDIKKIIPYVFEIVRRNNSKQISHRSSNLIEKIIINALEASIVQEEYKTTKCLLQMAELWQGRQINFEFKTWLLFWKGIFEKKTHLNENYNKKIGHAYKIAMYLNSEATVYLFDRFLKSLGCD
ncbi:helix-turn-helix domain-containing protein [Oenococcus oeni]|uniref:helix-turn-helix domain-containing protein n=1 Tax=Oenococcus oeni TaxID=1247 RepID=UPI0009514573|nr:helix-turn-helix domain-containing protein [Oenococcus oeni]